MKHRLTGFYPEGAIQTRAEIEDLIAQAKETETKVSLYTVNQMGYIGTFNILPTSELRDNEFEDLKPREVFMRLTGENVYIFTDKKGETYPSEILMGSYAIESSASNEHRAFTDLQLATTYSEELKNDPEYVQSVKDWWARCRELSDYYPDDDRYDYSSDYDDPDY